ncbi:MAG: metallophosphoesterase [Gaiellales bacterium]
MVFRKRRRESEDAFALYYASDVHGSDQCWRKFLGAGRFYEVNALVMGGDLTGKAIVPIELAEDGAFSAEFLGEMRRGTGEASLGELTEAIRHNGMYPWTASADELARMRSDATARAELFERVLLDELRRWVELADERMPPLGIAVYAMAGNDDPWSCDAVLEHADHLISCDLRVTEIGGHEMISCSYANPTPWSSPRELHEDALYARVKELADQLERPETAIFNLHVPPIASGLDTAYEIDDQLRIVVRNGKPHEIPVGSTAVRQLIEEYQPLLALHGHIHESREAATIGRTLAINSGSEYSTGRIHGVIVKLSENAVLSHQFTIG